MVRYSGRLGILSGLPGRIIMRLRGKLFWIHCGTAEPGAMPQWSIRFTRVALIASTQPLTGRLSPFLLAQGEPEGCAGLLYELVYELVAAHPVANTPPRMLFAKLAVATLR